MIDNIVMIFVDVKFFKEVEYANGFTGNFRKIKVKSVILFQIMFSNEQFEKN